MIKKFKRLFPKKPKTTSDQFIANFFSREQSKVIVQIGANDGQQNDPLRKYFKEPDNCWAILIEPIPYYVACLKKLYCARTDIKIINAAVGANIEIQNLYYIPPEVANQMNGDGPVNNWAHGQGSFDRSIVIKWIKANSFRGESYQKRIPSFIDSIKEHPISIRKTEHILPQTKSDVFLVVDVQGFELEVLKGINWTAPPRWIMLEDDLENTKSLLKYMNKKGFKWIAGRHDKVFENTLAGSSLTT